MKFDSIDALSEWLNEHTTSISNLDINLPTVTSGYVHVDGITDYNTTTTITTSSPAGNTQWEPTDGTVVESNNSTVVRKIAIKSLSIQPTIKQVTLSESKDDNNVWYVDSYESVEDACSTSKIIYKGSTMLMNVCESGGESKVTLIVDVDGDIARMEFKLEESCNNTSEYDMILTI